MAGFLRRLLYAVLLIAVQVLLLDRICLLGYSTPFLYILFVLILDSDVSPVQRMLWGFCMGLSVDVFMNTPGVQAASLTLLSYLQPSLLRLEVTFDRRDHINPGVVSMGWRAYSIYLIVGTLVFMTVCSLLGTLISAGPVAILVRILLSTVMTVLLMLAVELVFRKNQRRRFR